MDERVIWVYCSREGQLFRAPHECERPIEDEDSGTSRNGSTTSGPGTEAASADHEFWQALPGLAVAAAVAGLVLYFGSAENFLDPALQDLGLLIFSVSAAAFLLWLALSILVWLTRRVVDTLVRFARSTLARRLAVVVSVAAAGLGLGLVLGMSELAEFLIGATFPAILLAGAFFAIRITIASVIGGVRVARNVLTFLGLAPPRGAAAKRRRDAILAGLPEPFEISAAATAKPNPHPWYSVRWFEEVSRNTQVIEETSRRYGIDAEFIKAIVWLESTHGWIERLTVLLVPPKTIRPMNINADVWKQLGVTRRQLMKPETNIEVGVFIASAIRGRTKPATAERVATLYNNLNAAEVSAYGKTVAAYYRQRPWQRSGRRFGT